jgi:hypothetical protein
MIIAKQNFFKAKMFKKLSSQILIAKHINIFLSQM